jgi:signal transduction histidine kinase
MTIRTRLTVWYAGMLLASLALMGAVLAYELIYEQAPGGATAGREEPREQIAEILLFYGVPTAAFLAVGGWLLLRRTLAPIQALTAAAERVQADTLSQLPSLPGSGNGDELDRLTRVFNDMLARLDDSFRRTREFALHASHELKTPLTVLQGGLETLARDPRTAPDHREALASMMDETQRLARMVSDLLVLARAGEGQEPAPREPVALDELLREAAEDARLLGEPAGLTVTVPACEAVTLSADRHRLRQLWLILIDNAVRHNEAGGRIELSLRRGEGTAECAVANTGPTPRAEEWARLFEPFYRGEAARRERRDGCGLGLSLARTIVERHGGTIQAAPGPGGTTVIRFTLPVGTSANPG